MNFLFFLTLHGLLTLERRIMKALFSLIHAVLMIPVYWISSTMGDLALDILDMLRGD